VADAGSQKAAGLQSISSSGTGGGLAPCHRSRRLWARDFPSEHGKGSWMRGREQKGAGTGVRVGESSALALSEEQKSPPLALLCSCRRES